MRLSAVVDASASGAASDDGAEVEQHSVGGGGRDRREDRGLGEPDARNRSRRAALAAAEPPPPAEDAEHDVHDLERAIREEPGLGEQDEVEDAVRDPGRPGPDALAHEQPDRRGAGYEAKRLGHAKTAGCRSPSLR